LTTAIARLERLEEDRKKYEHKLTELKNKLMASEASASKEKKLCEELNQEKVFFH